MAHGPSPYETTPFPGEATMDVAFPGACDRHNTVHVVPAAGWRPDLTQEEADRIDPDPTLIPAPNRARQAAARMGIPTRLATRAARYADDYDGGLLITIPPGTDIPGAQHDDDITAVAAVDLLYHLASERAEARARRDGLTS